MLSKQTEESSARILVISGVDISKQVDEKDTGKPVPDYFILRNTLNPKILDIRTIKEDKNPLIRFIHRVLGHYFAIAFAAVLQAGKYQAIIATGEDVGFPLAFFKKLFWSKVPIIVTCHNISTRRPAFFLGRLKIGSAIQKFMCLSQSQAQILRDRYKIKDEQIHLFYWHVDHTFFNPVSTSIVKNQICSAGMQCRDYQTLIQATQNLDIDLKIAADSPYFREILHKTYQDLPDYGRDLSRRVEFRSYGTYAALRQLYADSRFVVVPLYDVDFSAGYTVILEAMAMGKAVIVSKIRQKDDFINEGINGFYVTPGDINELRERICYLLENPDVAYNLGMQGRKDVEDRFTLIHMINRVQSVLHEVIGKLNADTR